MATEGWKTFDMGIRIGLGDDRLRLGTYRMRSLLEAGMTVPGSTDSPVSDANPFESIHDLVNRRTASGREFVPAERVSVEEAVRTYTFLVRLMPWAARATSGRSPRAGSLTSWS